MAFKPEDDKPLDEYRYPSREVSQCPFPFYRALRNQAPVYQVPGTQEYLISRHEDVVAAAQRPEAFSNMPPPRPGPPEGVVLDPEIVAVANSQRYPVVPDILENDPPRHTVLRKLGIQAFTPKRLRTLEPHIQEITDALIDAFIDRGECDFVHEFANLLPLTVVCDLLGIPRADMPRLRRWHEMIDKVIAPPDFRPSREQMLAISRSQVEYQNYLGDLCTERRAHPADDALTELTHATDEDGQLFPLEEVVNVAHNLITGGGETSAYMLAHTLQLLLQHPDQLAEVKQDASLLPRAIEESLRLESPGQQLPRYLRCDVELHGTTLPQGARALLMWGAANRDERRFEEPDRFDIHRKNVKDHLAFGHGIHYCLGAPLARMEGVIAFRTLFRRLAHLRLAPGKNDFAHRDSTMLRALEHLYLEFERA